MRSGSRVRALVGLAVAHLRHERARTVLAVAGVATTVLILVLLASVGLGVVSTGQDKFEQSDRDLWVTGGPIELQPGTVGGFENSLINAHEIATQIEDRPAIQTAVPMAFQTVYASRTKTDFETLIAVGGPARGPSVKITAGQPFQHKDIHYGDGNYSGPMTHEVVINQQAADLLNVSVGDTLYIGGTLATARQHKFHVVGMSPTYSRFVGSPTVILHLSELQEVVGTTASDRATFITIDVAENASVSAVEQRLERAYPDYTVRTNQEQLRSILQNRALVIVSGGCLALLALVAAILLLANLQLSFVIQYRRVFGALKAVGTSWSSLLIFITVHMLGIGLLGGLIGIALAVPGVWAINYVVQLVTGFQQLVSISQPVLIGGLGIAISVSLIGSLAVSIYLTRLEVTEALQ